MKQRLELKQQALDLAAELLNEKSQVGIFLGLFDRIYALPSDDLLGFWQRVAEQSENFQIGDWPEFLKKAYRKKSPDKVTLAAVHLAQIRQWISNDDVFYGLIKQLIEGIKQLNDEEYRKFTKELSEELREGFI